MILRYTADAGDAGKTLFTILRYRLHMSAGLIRRCKFQTVMYVNDVPVHTDHRLRIGDRICLPLPEEHAEFPPEHGDLRILYEDESLIALFKQPGIIIHPSATRNTGTLANQLLGYLGSGTVHPLNRLDRDTTGVAVFAKNSYIKSILTDHMEHARIQKTYLAPVFGHLPFTSGTIELPIDRLDTDSLWRTVREIGQPALTTYDLLEQHGAWSLYAFHPKTGRTHQIRLHAFASGAPLLGEPYYTTEEARLFSQSLGLSVQQLCCTEMTFPHPLTGTVLSITCTPDYFSAPWFLSR